MSQTDDPRARFRKLPDPVRSDELVETSDVDRAAGEEPVRPAWEQIAMGGPGLP
jgi:hypothetical protein